jgi:hypothetical protein
VDALVRSRAVDFAELLGWLKREELQALCTALGLERGGREKKALVLPDYEARREQLRATGPRRIW